MDVLPAMSPPTHVPRRNRPNGDDAHISSQRNTRFFCHTFAVTSQDADALCREHHSEFVFWCDTTMNITFASVLVTFCCQSTKADSRVPMTGICWARSLWIMFLGPEFWCVPRTMRTQFDLMHVTSFRRPFLHALPKERLVVFGTHGINKNGLRGDAIIQF